MTDEEELRARAREADEAVFRGVARASLCPGRAQATSIPDIVVGLLREGVPMPILLPLAEGLVRLAFDMREAFPDNLFWDLDHLAAAFAREAMRADEPEAHLARALLTASLIQHLFGRGTTLQFRYVHDFLYGFDWAKWVEADAANRAHVGPFNLAFLERMKRRGEELVGLVANDDAKYGKIPEGVARNPFPFSRDVADETRLMRDLAARGALPVETWRLDATPTWNRPFYAMRQERAHALGLS